MAERNPIRILLAEDNLFTRMGTVTYLGLRPNLQVVAEAENGVEAVSLFRQHRPDVLVIDLKMPDLDGISATAQIRQEFPDARILLLTHHDGEEDIFRALQAGARGYLTKDVRGDELARAIEAVHQGKRYLPPHIAAKLADHTEQSALTRREQQVLEHIFRGLSNRQIAEALELSENTVAMHVSRMLAHLGAKSRTEAVSIGLGRGLLPPR